MTTKLRGDQLGTPFSINGSGATLSGTLIVNYHDGATKIISSANGVDPDYGLLFLNDASEVGPLPSNTPAVMILTPDDGLAMMGNFTGTDTAVMSVFGAAFGGPSLGLSVDDSSGSNTYQHHVDLTTTRSALESTNPQTNATHKFETTLTEGCKIISPIRTTISGGNLGVAILSSSDVVVTSTNNFLATGSSSALQSGSNSVNVTSSGTNVSGSITFLNGFTASTDSSITGNLAITGTVDGRDVSADGSTLDSHTANTTTAHGATSANTASKIVIRDANKNFQANHVQQAVTTTVTSGSTDNFSVTSAPVRVYSGSSSQGVNLPDATTLVVGHQFQIINTGTGTITIRDGGGSTVFTLLAYNSVRLTCTSIGTTAGTWSSGTSSVTSHTNYQSYVPFFTLYDNGNSGTSKTIDWNNGPKQKVTLTGNCTFAFTAPPGPCNTTLVIYVAGSGTYTSTFPAACKFPSGTGPVTTTASGTIHAISCFYTGTEYLTDFSTSYS